MRTDRYLKFILTVIALELLWLGVQQGAPAVSAQAAPTAVVITGIQLPRNNRASLPVAVQTPLRVDVNQPVTITTDGPLSVQQVEYTPKARPGE